MWRVVLVSCMCFATASASIYHSVSLSRPDKFKDIEGCYVQELDRVISFNTTTSENCVVYRCTENYTVVEECSVIIVLPSCTLIRDMEKPYPLCCAKLQCPPVDTE